ncbi:hypothetical protein GCM10017708_23270 [Arthrobacter citreus]
MVEEVVGDVVRRGEAMGFLVSGKLPPAGHMGHLCRPLREQDERCPPRAGADQLGKLHDPDASDFPLQRQRRSPAM